MSLVGEGVEVWRPSGRQFEGCLWAFGTGGAGASAGFGDLGGQFFWGSGLLVGGMRECWGWGWLVEEHRRLEGALARAN